MNHVDFKKISGNLILLALTATSTLLLNGCLATGGCDPLQVKKENAEPTFNDSLLKPVESENLVPLRGKCFELGEEYILTGQLPQPDFQFAKDNGVKTIVNVRMDRELGGLGFEMEPHINRLDLTFVHFPVGPDTFDGPQADRFIKLITDAEKPVLINGSNGNRIWGLWALYLGARWEIPVDRTKEVATANGIKKLVIEDFVRGYLDARNKK